MAVSEHPAPNQSVYALSQRIAFAAAMLLVISAPAQVVLAFAIPNGFLFVVTAILSLLLVLPLILALSATPPVTLRDDGLTLHPLIGRSTTIRWEDVRELKPYPLLPSADSESLRRAAVGRKKYQAAAGLMLVCPSLPARYRVVGFFAGEGFTPVVAVTNRTHVNYAHLAYTLTKALE